MAQFPDLSIASQSLDQVNSFYAEFGLIPSSRNRISLAEHR